MPVVLRHHSEVQKAVGISEVQHTEKIFNVTVAIQRQVPTIQKAQRMLEVLHMQYFDRVADVPMIQMVERTAEIPKMPFVDRTARRDTIPSSRYWPTLFHLA